MYSRGMSEPQVNRAQIVKTVKLMRNPRAVKSTQPILIASKYVRFPGAPKPRVSMAICSSSDPLNNEISYTYDGVGNLTKVTDASGQEFLYTYDVPLLNQLIL